MIVLLTNLVLLWSFSAAQLAGLSQPEVVQTLPLEASATLKCYIAGDWPIRVWYKLSSEKGLVLIVTVDSDKNLIVFANEFYVKYSVNFTRKENHLIISTMSWDDAGTYFCGVLHENSIQFGNGTYLMVKGGKLIRGSVSQHPVSQSVQSGRSVTLSCSVNSGQCAAEDVNVKWLRLSDRFDSERHYFYGKKKATLCQWTESGDTTCVYTLRFNNFSSKDEGVYVCVVNPCGKTILGNGSELYVGGFAVEPFIESSPFPIVIALSMSLPLLVCVIAMGICHCTESCDSSSKCITNKEDKEYTNLTVIGQMEHTWSECVYLSVKKHL